jgi:hypothetical protein
MSTSYFNLTLPGTPTVPRELRLKRINQQLFVWMSAQGMVEQPLAYASGYLTECHLNYLGNRHALWIKTTSFELTPEEAEKVKALLESPCAEKTIGPNSAKQAASVNSPDGKRGELPPPDALCSGGGTLEGARS